MALVPYARSNDDPNTQYMTFRVIHSDRGGSDDAAATVDRDTGKSPITRWYAWYFDYDDAVLVGSDYIIKCQVPPNTIAMKAMVRIDTVFDGIGSDDVDIGDTNVDGWMDGESFQSAGLIFDHDAAYNTGTANAGVAGPQLYSDGDTIDIDIGTAASTQGRGVLFLESISYNEELNAEW